LLTQTSTFPQRAERLSHDGGAAVQGAEIRLQQGMVGAKLTGQRSRAIRRAPEADADPGARGGEGDGDRLPYP